MRFKQFLESVAKGTLKKGDLVVATDDIFIGNTNEGGHIPSTYANKGQLMEIASEDLTRELINFWIVYEDGDRSRYQWYADSTEFYANVKKKRDYDRDFLNSLKEEQIAKNDYFVMVKPMNMGRAAMVQGSIDSKRQNLDIDVGQVLHRLGYDTKSGKTYFKQTDPSDGQDLFTLWWAWTADWSECCVPQDDYRRDWMKGLVDLDEAVDTAKLDLGQHVFVVNQITGTAEDNGHRTPFWWGDELEFMGFDEASGRVIAHAFSEEEQETYTYFFDDVEFRDSLVTADEFKKLKRKRDERFLKGLVDPDEDINEDRFDLGRLKVGQKFKVQVPFSALECELRNAFHFAKGEDIEYAGSKPFKNGKIIYFFGKKDEYKTHYMFELPEALFFKSTVPAERFVKEDHAPEKVEVGQTRIILDPILGVRNGQLIPFDPGTKIKITGKVLRRSEKNPRDIFGVVTFTHEDHGDQDFDYLERELEIRTLTPEEKKRRDLSFINSLKEDEKFHKADEVWFKTAVHAIRLDGTPDLVYADAKYVFFGFEDGYALISHRWRKVPTIKVPLEEFNKFAETKRERDRRFLNGLKEDVGAVYVVNADILIRAIDDSEPGELYQGDVVKVISEDERQVVIAISDNSLGAPARGENWNARHWTCWKKKFYKAVTPKAELDKEFFNGLVDKDE